MTQAELDRQTDLKNGIIVCTGCYWYRSACGVARVYMMCHYSHDTNLERGYTPAECYKHDGTPYKAEIYKGHGRDIKIKGE